jgi:hypothetical protein
MKSGKAQAKQAKLYFERAQMALVGNTMFAYFDEALIIWLIGCREKRC